jgi:flagellar biosynthesis/type III secretory pathway protein FliH
VLGFIVWEKNTFSVKIKFEQEDQEEIKEGRQTGWKEGRKKRRKGGKKEDREATRSNPVSHTLLCQLYPRLAPDFALFQFQS